MIREITKGQAQLLDSLMDQGIESFTNSKTEAKPTVPQESRSEIETLHNQRRGLIEKLNELESRVDVFADVQTDDSVFTVSQLQKSVDTQWNIGKLEQKLARKKARCLKKEEEINDLKSELRAISDESKNYKALFEEMKVMVTSFNQSETIRKRQKLVIAQMKQEQLQLLNLDS